jgi:hypothetical protein
VSGERCWLALFFEHDGASGEVRRGLHVSHLLSPRRARNHGGIDQFTGADICDPVRIFQAVTPRFLPVHRHYRIGGRAELILSAEARQDLAC